MTGVRRAAAVGVRRAAGRAGPPRTRRPTVGVGSGSTVGGAAGPDDLGAVARARVVHPRLAGPAPRPRPGPAAVSASSSSGDPRVLRLRLAVHPGDRRARQDVVELVQQHRLPQPVELLVRIGVARDVQRGRRRPQLGLAQRVFAAPVALLGAGLGGVGGAVQLQVELAGPHGGVRVLGARGLAKKSSGCSTTTFAEPSRSASRRARSMHLAGGAATAVAVPERRQRARTARPCPA